MWNNETSKLTNEGMALVVFYVKRLHFINMGATLNNNMEKCM